MNNDLDTRARAAARALRAATDNVNVPEPRPARSRRPVVGLAIAGACAVALLVAVVFVNGGDDPEDVFTIDDTATTAVAPTADAVPRLILDPVPAGLEPTGTVELPTAVRQSAQVDYTLYAGDDPASEPDLGVLLIGWEDLQTPELPEGEDVDLGGVVARRIDEPLIGPAMRTYLVVPVDRTTWLGVASDTLDDDSVAAHATTLLDLVEDGRLAVPDELPAAAGGDALSRVAQGDDRRTELMRVPIPPAPGWGIGYQHPEQIDRAISIATVAGGEEDLAVARWALGPDAEQVDIDGRPAWMLELVTGGLLVAWSPEPGVLTSAMSGLSREETLDALGSLRPATDEEWAALPEGDDDQDEPNPYPEGTVGGVATQDAAGGDHAVYAIDDGSLCLRSEGTESCSGSSSGPPRVLAQRLASGEVLVYGLSAEGDQLSGAWFVSASGEHAPGGLSFAYPENGGLVFAQVVPAGDPRLDGDVAIVDREGTILVRMPVPEPT